MLVLPAAGLVLLENPKTATQSLRALLRADAVAEAPRHAAWHVWAEAADSLAARFGTAFETVAVVREPLERARSWHRYRQRPGIESAAHSTAHLTFADFLREVLKPKPPPFARIGRQDRFVGWDGRQAAVDHVFDYARLDLLLAFLGARLGRDGLRLPRRNVSPPARPEPPPPPDLLAAFAEARTAEYALWRRVAAAGSLHR